MSEAEKANQKSNVFLKQVRLKNYKSIIDAEIDFKPGLNIIIGNNGSGKTNMLKCLNNVLEHNYNEQPDTESMITIFNKNGDVQLNAYVENTPLLLSDYHKINSKFNFTIIHDQKYIQLNDIDELKSQLLDFDSYWNIRIVDYTNPYLDSFFIEKPMTLILVQNGKRSREVFSKGYVNTRFMFMFLFRLYHHLPIEKGNVERSLVEIEQDIINYLNYTFIELNENLKVHTPISEVRINEDFILVEELNGKLSITNFYLEFKVNDKWLPFKFLSDGTKRLFYIISEFTNLFSKAMSVNEDSFEIALLEEPELGIHPHQLHKLMLFIKEQSKEKQIILTTHSPQVLNILDADELDRIIICNYDKEKGTQLRHLTEKETHKAKLYMQEDFLSDYWIYSDLEPIN